MKEIKDLIKKQDIQLGVITKLLLSKECTQKEREKYEACGRFIVGFICDLKKINEQYI